MANEEKKPSQSHGNSWKLIVGVGRVWLWQPSSLNQQFSYDVGMLQHITKFYLSGRG